MDKGWWVRLVGALVLVVVLAASWPAAASTGMAMTPPRIWAWLDPLFVFLPLLWAPLPAWVMWRVIERMEAAERSALKESPPAVR